MSRCFLKGKKENLTVIVGIQTISPLKTSWFVQLHDKEKEDQENEGYIMDIDPASKGAVLKVIATYADPELIYNQEVMKHVALDLDPGNVP